jgi:hypothetical protein
MPKIHVKKFYQDLSCYAIKGDKMKKKTKTPAGHRSLIM